MQIPNEGQRVLIDTYTLPDCTDSDNTYSFSIDRRGGAIVVHVPGHHRGPDICKPERPEQESFLDGLEELMRRSWGCQWTLHDDTALEAFIKMLEPLLKSYRVLIG